MLPVRPGPLAVFPAVYTATGACRHNTKNSKPAFANAQPNPANTCYIGHPEIARLYTWQFAAVLWIVLRMLR